MAGKRRVLLFLVPLLATALVLLLDLEGWLSRPSGWIYDAAFRLKPPAAAVREILLLDVDDRAVAVAGPWPWTAETIANGLAQLQEFDADRVVFDLALPDTAEQASTGVAPSVVEAFDREFAAITGNIGTLFEGIRRGSVLPKDAPGFVDALIGLVETAKARLLGEIAGGRSDPDAALAGAMRAFGRAWISWELRSDRSAEAVPAALYASARGDGFRGADADPDGVLRRALPVVERQGRRLVPAAFEALLDRLGSPSLRLEGRRLVLAGARPPGMPARDVVLDLAEDGRLLLDWPATATGSTTEDGFRHLSWGDLAELDWLEKDLVAALRAIRESGILGSRGTSLLDRYDDAAALRERLLAGDGTASAAEWLDARNRFFALAEEALLAPAADADGGPADEAPPLLAEARRALADIRRSRAALREQLAQSFCIVSLATRSAPGSLGRTPRGAVASVGSSSAALVNTVLTARRLAETPDWIGKALGVALSLLATIAALRLRVRGTLLAGVLLMAATVAGSGGLLVAAGWYLDPVVAAASTGLTCAALAGVKALGRFPGRRALRRRFANRIPRSILRGLVAEPARAPAAGSEQRVTVLCGRVAGLSAAAGRGNPAALAAMLNGLHAELGRIVLAYGGTIGRAEGDALEAYFGAPLEGADDSRRACRCALRMQAAAKELGARFIADHIIPAPLALRIGIAAGDCLAGDLGMPGVPGYTVLGAARDAAWDLARSCERFGAATLVTGPVWEAGGKELLARMLDRLPLPTDPDPVRCLELVSELEGADAATVEAIGLFNEGLALLEAGNRSGAAALFERVHDRLPNDGPSAVYAARCRDGS